MVLRAASFVLSLVLLSVMAGGCAVETNSTDKPEKKPEIYDKIVDGTWDYGDYGLNTVVKNGIDNFKITVTGPPTLTTTDGGKTILMSSPLTFERVVPKTGFAEKDEPIAESESLLFSPGTNLDPMNEDYGEDTELKCKSYPKSVGDKASCELSFEATKIEIKNSHWQINGQLVAAWPGQKP